ncbi:MAG: thiamine pyrophosphate-dependent enzyme [Lacisediminihabitans sp.]
MTTTVREACFDVMRAEKMMTIFSNPGSTEIPFLTDLPNEFRFVLALHEGSVVGIACGYALATDTPAFVLLHTTAGLGNGVSAIATARVNHAPMVVVVGQQDRRHLALEPFLAGRLEGLAGDYPLEVLSPVLAADVPSALLRAAHVAREGRGPVIVIVPMDDWDAPAEPTAVAASTRSVVSPYGVPTELTLVSEALRSANSPAILAGSGNDSEAGWASLVALAERLNAPVWQEPFGSRAGFPQDHPLYRGQLPADRPRVRDTLDAHDVLLVVGTAAIRQYPYKPGPLVPETTRVFVLTADAAEAHRSPAELAIIGNPSILCDELTAALLARGHQVDLPLRTSPYRLENTAAGPLRAAHVFQLLADRLPAEVTIVEESPSSRPALESLLPARRPNAFLSAAMGGLGFAMPAAIGLKLGRPRHPVLAIIGDGSSMYSIQSLWTAVTLGIGTVFIVFNNGGYAVMNRLAEQRGGTPAWPSFGTLSVSTIARGFGMESRVIESPDDLITTLDEVIPTLADRTVPLLLEVVVEPDESFAP